MLKRHTICVLVLLSAALAGAAVSARQAPTPYEAVLFGRDVMVTMRDGTKLAVDIYRPGKSGAPVPETLPVLLQRTPYNKDSLAGIARYFAQHGYVVAVEDIRGRYKSGGAFGKYDESSANDGYDTIEWLAKQPYTNGRIGMWGTSYAAHTQADAAKVNPPSLKALLLNFGGLSNGWKVKVRNHGAFELGQQLGWAFDEAGADDPLVRAALELEPVEKWFAAMPLRKGLNPLSASPEFETYLLEQMTHGDYDDYWKNLGNNWSEHYVGTSNIPMLHVGGWYDAYTASTLENYVGLTKAKKGPMRLLVGPWIHGGNGRTGAGDVEFGPESTIPDFGRTFHLAWFDQYLKGATTTVGTWPAIRLFVMGTGDGRKTPNGKLFHGGYWRDAAAWPLPETTFVSYFFHADGSLSATAPAAGVKPTTYQYDPRHPVPTIGGSFSGALKRGPFDQREREFKSLRGGSENGFYGSRPPFLPLKSRADVVVFQTEPLREDVEVVGPIVVNLLAASTATDTDFTAKLIDVYPPSKEYPTGFDMNLTDGIIRARYRNSPAKQEFMKPGEVYAFMIEPFATANVFKKGHRIRIDISSSNFPRFDVNPNTGEPLGQNRRLITADNSVYHDARYASHVVLPIVPSRGPSK